MISCGPTWPVAKKKKYRAGPVSKYILLKKGEIRCHDSSSIKSGNGSGVYCKIKTLFFFYFIPARMFELFIRRGLLILSIGVY